jgi:tRNA threonylcarbamoyladenosine biosynthesis protein TsaB
MKSKILAIETSSNACSAALLINEEIIQCYELAPQQHAQLILPMVKKLLTDAALNLSQLDAIAFGCGPGSFTGIRIAASVAQSLAFGADLPVIPVSTLRVLAQGALTIWGANKVLAGVDARIDEIYFGVYEADNGLMQQQLEDGLYKPNDLPLLSSGEWFGVGDAWEVYAETLKKHFGNNVLQIEARVYPQAKYVAELAHYELLAGKVLAADKALPVYLRNKVTS